MTMPSILMEAELVRIFFGFDLFSDYEGEGCSYKCDGWPKENNCRVRPSFLFSYKSPLRWNGSQLSHQDLANASPPIMARG